MERKGEGAGESGGGVLPPVKEGGRVGGVSDHSTYKKGLAER